MRRRDFIAALGGATAWMSAVHAQEPRHVIGFLSGFSAHGMPGSLAAIYNGLKETGFVEGKNISIEFRWGAVTTIACRRLRLNWWGRNVSVLFADDLPSAFAAKAATKTIPIVFGIGADAVRVGLVESIGRPHRCEPFFSILGPKRVELMRELLPTVDSIALLGNPDNANLQPDLPDIRVAAEALRQRLEVLTASTESGLGAVFATMVQHRVGALVLQPDPSFISRRESLLSWQRATRCPRFIHLESSPMSAV